MAPIKLIDFISIRYLLIFHPLNFVGLLSGDREIFFVEFAILGIVFIPYKDPFAVFKEQKVFQRISPL